MRHEEGYRRHAVFRHRLLMKDHSRRSSLRQVADLILEPGHRLFARHGVEVVRIGLPGPLGGGQPQTLSAFDLIAEELEPLIDMNDPGLLRMEADPKFIAQE